MARRSPAQEVSERFGSKLDLAKQLSSKLERPYEDESDEEFDRRVRTMSNKKLLRLHALHETVERDFGGKKGLVDAIMELRYVGSTPDLQYRAKLETLRLTRLVDLHRGLSRAQKN